MSTGQLDWSKKQDTTYCIPLWLRDEQIAQAIKRVPGRIQPGEKKSDPVAIVGFGPSLQDTWEKVKDFKYVISCSGSHKFLIERGIIPTWHVEVDPREHKVGLMGPPSKDTTYLISSTCHPKVFDHLEGFNVLLWHVFDNSEDGKRLLPPGEWALTGGCDVGMRSISIAAFFGFRDLHMFGFDGSARGAVRHAAEHPYTPKKYGTTTYEGIEYLTTPGMLEAARQIWHELDQLPAVKATFYGEGLIQHMAKNYKRNEKETALTNAVGFAKPQLISDEYRELNSRLHKDRLDYGVNGGRLAPIVKKMMAKDPTIKSVLDYGAGKGYLGKALGFPIWEYDPAIPGKDESPKPADLVVCGDVLEHVEPDKIAFVLMDLARCVKKIGLFVIHTGPSSKKLADGRNAHVLQRPKPWWEKNLEQIFTVGTIIEKGYELYVLVGPKKAPKVKKSVQKQEGA